MADLPQVPPAMLAPEIGAIDRIFGSPSPPTETQAVPPLPPNATAEEVSAHVRVHVAKYHIQVQEPKTKKRRVQLKDPEARRLRDNLRNKEHAKVSRLRKKFFVKELEQQLEVLEDMNRELQGKMREYLTAEEMAPLIQECAAATSLPLTEMVQRRLDAKGTTGREDASPRDRKREAPSTFTLQELQRKQMLNVAITNRDGCFMSASKGLTRMTGYSINELLSKADEDLHSESVSQNQVKRIRSLISSGQKDVSATILHRHNTGYPYLTSYVQIPMHNHKLEPVNRVCIYSDVPASTMAAAYISSIKRRSKATAEDTIRNAGQGRGKGRSKQAADRDALILDSDGGED